MKTHSVKEADINKGWFVVDAEGQTLGRMASQIAYVLRGKHKPTYVPYLDCGDNVVVINADKITLTGRKLDQKVYYHHTNYIGGIKAITAGKLLDSHPERVLASAVKGMLPRNKIGRKMAKSLKVYSGAAHPHEAQRPSPLPVRLRKGV